MNKLITHITGWLRHYLEASGQKGFVIGVSGGVDSALTSALCALTGKETLCLELAIHQDKHQVNRSLAHIGWLKETFSNTKGISIDLSETFETFKHSLSNDNRGYKTNELALANTRSRLRMTTLYYYASLHEFLVVGTGNKVEDFGIGFFTKYGDGGVDVSPIADLTKTEVFKLAEILGVSEDILKAPPTDGLWDDNRVDEQQIGATYAELERAMEIHQQNLSGIDLSNRDQEVLEIYTRLHNANLHKMKPIPVCNIPNELRVEL